MAKPRTGVSKNRAWQGCGGVQPQSIASFIRFLKAFPKVKLSRFYIDFPLCHEKGRLINC